MADEPHNERAIPTLEDWQHWTLVMGRAQQMLMESGPKAQEGPAWPRLVGAGVRLSARRLRRPIRWR